MIGKIVIVGVYLGETASMKKALLEFIQVRLSV